MLAILHRMESGCDLRLWGPGQSLDEAFIMIGRRSVFLLNMQPEGTPVMTHITHGSYLYRYHQYLVNSRRVKQSFNRRQARDLLMSNPDFINESLGNDLKAVYYLTNIGLFLNDEDLAAHEPDPVIRKAILDINALASSSRGTAYISSEVMESFAYSDRIILPLIGPIERTPAQRKLQAERIIQHMNSNQEAAGKLTVLGRPSERAMAVVCTSEMALLYFPEPSGSDDKFHVLFGSSLDQAFNRELGIADA